MVLEDAVATPNKYDFGLINDKNTIHLPRQHSYIGARKPVFTKVLVTRRWLFRTNLGQKTWYSDINCKFDMMKIKLWRYATA